MNRRITRRPQRVAVSALLAAVAAFALEPVDGTTGPPLGGVGAGMAKFCAWSGTFAFNDCTPVGIAMGTLDARFQFFSKRGTTVATRDTLKVPVVNGHATDDAIFPCQFADFGTINGIAVTMTAFAPIEFNSIDHMSNPYAFYEFTFKNTGTETAEAAAAFLLNVGGMSARAGKGMSNGAMAIDGQSTQSGAVLSCGSDNGFFTAGQCSNTMGDVNNRVAVKLSLAAGATGSARFVLSWVNRRWGDTTHYYYSNTYSNASAVADSGLKLFDTFKTNAVSLVTRMRGSNFPDWLKNLTMNSMCNLVNNSIYTRDGRYCYFEGAFGIYGTMDQMWHARQINSMAVPYLAWQELRYWARTQKSNPEGQIHHEFAGSTDFISGWDERQHNDYRDIDSWVDLNCGFILTAYETFMATDDHGQLDFLWPYVKSAGQRIPNQALPTAMGNATYPYTFNGSGSSYDNGGNSDVYNSGLVVPTFVALARLAEIKGETALTRTYDSVATVARTSFTKRFLETDFYTGTWCEAVLAGQWISEFLRLGPTMDRLHFDNTFQKLVDYYKPLTSGLGNPTTRYDTFNEWQTYLISHFAGPALQYGRFDVWRAMAYDFWEKAYTDRNAVFSIYISVEPKVTTPVYLATKYLTGQYISVPVLWRNYYTALGYQRDKHTGELWLEPRILPEMNHVMSDGFFISPEGMGTVSCTETGAQYQNQEILFKPGSTIFVSTAYVRDSFSVAGPVYVQVDGANKQFTRVGNDYDRRIAIVVNDSVQASGMRIVVSDTPPAGVLNRASGRLSPTGRFAVRGGMISFGNDATVGRIELLDARGRLLANSSTSKGRSGQLVIPANAAGTCFVRFVGTNGSVVEKFVIAR